MTPASFPEENTIIDPPDGFSADQVQVMYAFSGDNHLGLPVSVTCWKLSRAEVEELLKTRTLWITVMGRTMAPLLPTVESPFLQVAKDEASSQEQDSA